MSPIHVALVTKALVPPHHDGTKVLVRELVRGSRPDVRFVYVGEPKRSVRWAAGDRVLAPWSLGGAAARLQTLALGVQDVDVVHGLFVPNQASSAGLRAIGRARALPVVQTITAGHAVARKTDLLRGLDAVVCTSQATTQLLRDVGVANVRTIHPGIEVPPRADALRSRTVLYAGDLDPLTASRLVEFGRALRARGPLDGWELHIVCRPKGEGDARARILLNRELRDLMDRGVVRLEGTVDDLIDRLGRCGAVLFCAPHCARKVDVPLVVLEAMARGAPALVLTGPPAQEVFDTAGVAPGRLARSVPDLVTWLAAQSPERLAAAGDAARMVVQARFSSTVMADAYLELYRSLGPRPR